MPLICSLSFENWATKEKHSISKWGIKVAKLHQISTELKTDKKGIGFGHVTHHNGSIVKDIVYAAMTVPSWVAPLIALISYDHACLQIYKTRDWQRVFKLWGRNCFSFVGWWDGLQKRTLEIIFAVRCSWLFSTGRAPNWVGGWVALESVFDRSVLMNASCCSTRVPLELLQTLGFYSGIEMSPGSWSRKNHVFASS